MQPRPGGAAGDSSSGFSFAALFPGACPTPLPRPVPTLLPKPAPHPSSGLGRGLTLSLAPTYRRSSAAAIAHLGPRVLRHREQPQLWLLPSPRLGRARLLDGPARRLRPCRQLDGWSRCTPDAARRTPHAARRTHDEYGVVWYGVVWCPSLRRASVPPQARLRRRMASATPTPHRPCPPSPPMIRRCRGRWHTVGGSLACMCHLYLCMHMNMSACLRMGAAWPGAARGQRWHALAPVARGSGVFVFGPPQIAERRRARARALLEERLQKANCAPAPAATAAAQMK